jgi:dihydrolipoamide dehydrogenase
MESFDLVVIGGGPGGYVGAIRAAQLGLKVACIESRGALGGTCLNVGCIPSKAWLESSEVYAKVAHHGSEFGIVAEKLKADIGRMLERKNDIIKKFAKGIEGLFKKNKITYYKGKGSFVNSHQVAIDGKEIIVAQNIVIATGSEPIEIPAFPFDGKNIVSSTEALDFEKVPKHLVVIGGGVIGLELGSVWCRLGAKVTVLEAAPHILANMDLSVSKSMTKILKDQGLEIYAGAKVESCKVQKDGVKVQAINSKGETIHVECEKVLVAVGRKAFTKGLNLEAAGIALDERGRIATNDHWQSSVPHIFAVGDVTKGLMLAHKAEEEGVAVAEFIATGHAHINYDAIPNVIYTWPEVASVGKTEEECKSQGIEIRTGQFPFAANGRAACNGTTDGFVKIIAEAKSDRIVGAHIVGPNASELIAELAVAMEFGASSEDIARSTHAHPTLSEVIKEAALAVDKRALHI